MISTTMMQTLHQREMEAAEKPGVQEVIQKSINRGWVNLTKITCLGRNDSKTIKTIIDHE
jgi:hypothetical protein